MEGEEDVVEEEEARAKRERAFILLLTPKSPSPGLRKVHEGAGKGAIPGRRRGNSNDEAETRTRREGGGLNGQASRCRP